MTNFIRHHSKGRPVDCLIFGISFKSLFLRVELQGRVEEPRDPLLGLTSLSSFRRSSPSCKHKKYKLVKGNQFGVLIVNLKASFKLVAGRRNCHRGLGCIANKWKIF